MVKAVVVVSGGMDSTTLLYDVCDGYDPEDVSALSFDYGQRHKKELMYAMASCETLGVQHHVVDLQSVTKLIKTSALTDPGTEVPEGHYEDATMRITVVPNRNAMMLNIAIAHAVSVGASVVFTGVHAGDHAVYPDCRPEFIEQMTKLARIANEGFIDKDFRIFAPFVTWTKAEIAEHGQRIGVDWNCTWTCYKGGDIHCGRCSTCLERIEAFSVAGVLDPVEYADLSYYNDLVKEGKLQ